MKWERKCQRIESQIDRSQSTEAQNIVKSFKTNNTSRESVINMETVPPGPSSIKNDAHGIEKLLLKHK